MNTINATMTTAAMATMATVDAPTITLDVLSGPMCPKPRRRLELLAPLASSSTSRPRMEWRRTALDATDAEHRQRVAMLQPAELAVG